VTADEINKIKEKYETQTFKKFQERLAKNAYYRRYNVEFELDNGNHRTFSNTLIAVNGNLLYFESEENGLDIIRTDRITAMTCIDRQTKVEDKQ
jgi:hypothetical protein